MIADPLPVVPLVDPATYFRITCKSSPVNIQVFVAEAHDIGSTRLATKRVTDKNPMQFPTENPEAPYEYAVISAAKT